MTQAKRLAELEHEVESLRAQLAAALRASPLRCAQCGAEADSTVRYFCGACYLAAAKDDNGNILYRQPAQ